MSTAITFDDMSQFTGGYDIGLGFVETTSRYAEDGFVISAPGTDSSGQRPLKNLYSGIIADGVNHGASLEADGTATLARADGTPFGIQSLQVYASPATFDYTPANSFRSTITFVGIYEDGSKTTLTFFPRNGYFETLEFPEGFSKGLVALEWSDGGSRISVDNIVLGEPPNTAPLAAPDVAAILENSTLKLDVLANDTDADAGAVLSLVSASAPEGKGTVALVDDKLVFTPGSAFDRLPAGAEETVVLSYTMQDQHGVQSSSTVTVTITGVNDAPVAGADVQTVVEDRAVVGDVLLNDSDVDAGDRLSVSAVSFEGAAGAVGTALSGRYGTLTLAADGTYTYAADADLLDTLTGVTGLTDVFTYEVSDGRGGVHTATLEIQVSLADDTREITGDKRSDVLLGDEDGPGAEDTIYGLTGADTIDGREGADRLFGGEGHDVIRGGQGRDVLFGDGGSDTLDGGDGDDRLSGGRGGDVLTGGSGRDVFVFEAKGGSDLVTDFEVGVDRIELDGVSAQGLFHIDLNGNGVIDGVLQLDDSFVVLLDVGAVGMEALLG